VVATLPVGRNPVEIALNPRTGLLYVPGELSNELSVIDRSNNTVVAEVSLGCNGPCTNSSTGIPNSVEVNPSTNMIFVANNGLNSLQILNGSSDKLVATIPVGAYPDGVAVNPDSNLVYVSNMLNNTVSVVNATSKSVIKTLSVATQPGDAVYDPVLDEVFVSNEGSNTVSVIGTQANSSAANVVVGPRCCGPMGIGVDSASGDVYVAVPSTGNVSAISKCTSLTCPVISGATPKCGSYAVAWTYPNQSPIAAGSHVASTVTTCTRGSGSWSIVVQPSNQLIASGNFSCPCADTSLFNYTAGLSPLTKGTYYFQESFGGSGQGSTLGISSP
jgi:YVTN family beta-propeller protein